MFSNKLTSTFLLSFTFLLAQVWLLAQPVNNLVKDVVMPTPTATAFGKYVDIPVSYNTGVPNISIPIHTIQEGPLSVPVGLSYHAAGVKVGELASWVGLGWNLQAGGMISRTVMNVPDEKTSKYGYYKEGINLTSTKLNNGALQTPMLDGNYDTEPDLFTFSMPGYSGKFYSNGNEGFTLIDRQDITIKATHTPGEEFDGFVITTPDGTRYIFGKDPNGDVNAPVICEKQRVNDSQPARNSWCLIKIETHDRKFSITYTYVPENYSYRGLASSRFVYSYCEGGNILFSLGAVGVQSGWSYQYPGSLDNTSAQAHPYMRNDIEGQRLSQISTSSGTTKVILRASTNRQDVDANPYNYNDPGKELDTIKIELGSNYRCKQFVLSQSYWTGDFYPNGQSEIKRLRLGSVQEFSCTTGESAVTIPAHTFEYETKSGSPDFLPNRLSKAVDHWGFYNAAESTNENAPVNVPTTVVTFDGSSATYQSPNNVNRNTHATAIKYGTLKAINYPTGGKTEFTFEANTVPDQEAQLTPFSKPGLDFGNVIQNCAYPYQPGQNSGDPSPCCVNNSKNFTFSLTANEISTGVVEMKVTYMNRNESVYCSDQNPSAFLTLEVYNVTDGFYMGTTQINASANNTNATSTISIELNKLAHFGNVFVPNTKQYRFTITVTQGWGRVSFFTRQYLDIAAPVGGLRIAQMRTQKSTTQAADDIIRTYEYNLANGLSSGKLIRKPKYSFVQAGTGVIPGSVYVYRYILLNSDSEVPLSSAEGYHLRYERVTENFNGNGKKVYTYFIETPYNEYLITNNQFPTPPTQIMASDGKLKQEETFSAADPNQFQAKTFITPQVVYQTSSAKMAKMVRLGVVCSEGTSSGNPIFGGLEYTIRSGIYRPVTVESTLDGVSTTTSYTYDPTNRFLAPTAIATTNSDGKTYTTEYTYPHDAGGPEITEMINRNLIATPIQVVKKHNGQILEGSRTGFSFFTLNGSAYTQTYTNSTSNPIYPWFFERYEATWDANGQLIKTDPGGDGWDLQGTILSYTTNGLPKELRMNNWNDSEFFTWTNAGRIQQRQFKNFTWNYAYYSGTQLLQSITDIDGQVTSFEYDALARLKKTTARGGNVFTTYSYAYKDAAQANLNHITTTTTFTPVSGSNLTSKTSREYFDGLGRMLQSIQVAHSPQSRDVISAVEYDNQGRISKEYTPYHSANSTGQYVAIPGGHTYALKQYYASPLNRLSSVTPPQWYPSTYTYGANTTVDNVWLNGSSSTTYAANLLSKTIVTDPEGIKSISFTDKLGRAILVRKDSAALKIADTYTLYDDKNRITTVIPPGATLSTPDLLFKYRYNGIDQITDKFIPDAGWTTLRYNIRDLLYGVQDANNLALGRWLGTKYDDYGRPIETGFVSTFPSDPNAAISFTELLSKTWYDGYDGYAQLNDPQYKGKVRRSETRLLDGASNWLFSVYTYDAHGRATAINSNNHLNLGISNAEALSMNYDWADNIIYEGRAHNPGAAGATGSFNVQNTYTYDAAGRRTNFLTTIGGAGQHVAEYNYNYRNELIEKNLHANFYNNAWAWLQSIDYSYNVQGWLTAINHWNASATVNTPALCTPAMPNPASPTRSYYNEDSDLFMLDLRYDQPETGISGLTAAPAQKAGNISQIVYRVRGREASIVSYKYDYLRRLKTSIFHNYSDAGVISGTNNYNESLAYDLRGNIQNLQRTGYYTNGGTCTYGQIDLLTYSYTSNTNRLHKILDGTTTTGDAKSRGFNGNLSTADNSMTYDANGNLNKNLHKNISSITYNHLNLPKLITFSTGNTIEFLYDAGGMKLRKTVKVGATIQYVQDYLSGGIEYRQVGTGVKRVEAVNHAEGRYYNINVEASNTISWRREYNFKDHLGNTRLVFTDRNGNGIVDITGTASTSDVLQENHYYGFGMAFEGAWLQNDTGVKDNKYQYNGKEFNDDFGLNWNDYGARWYDGSIGRWNAVDPLAEKYTSWNPYVYTINNPIRLIDPDGRFPITPGFRQNYPQLTSFIENRLQNYIQNSPKMLATLNKYSTGNLTPAQIASDFKPKNGPTITAHDFVANANQGGEYDYGSNTIKLSNNELARFESILNNPDPEKQKWGEMDFTNLFINEYTHYGDALDGFDAVLDQSGNVVNSDIIEPGDFGHGVFDEGNDAAKELFPYQTGRQNYYLYKTGDLYSPTSGTPVGSDKSKIDPTMIPPNRK